VSVSSFVGLGVCGCFLVSLVILLFCRFEMFGAVMQFLLFIVYDGFCFLGLRLWFWCSLYFCVVGLLCYRNLVFWCVKAF